MRNNFVLIILCWVLIFQCTLPHDGNESNMHATAVPYCITSICSQGVASPGGKAPLKIISPSPANEIRPLAFKLEIKKGKILQIKSKTAINRHHAFVAVCFSISKWSRSVAQ